MEMILSPLSSFMPRTPSDSRPLNNRTVSFSKKRMHWPRAVVKRTSSSGVQMSTATMLSPSPSFMAILPLRLMFSKSDNALRRTLPESVANTSCNAFHVSESSGSGRMEVITSPWPNGSRLTSALPIACGVAAGNRHTFMR